MKTLYFDCFSGVSGDMTIGALVDLGVDFDFLRAELAKLPLADFDAASEVRMSRVVRSGVHASKFDVVDPHHGHHHDHHHGHGHFHRRASEIITMISSSGLDARVRARAVRIFEKLAIAEGRVHDVPPSDVEFHEVGAIDSIVDVVGTAIGIEALEVGRIACSAINVGGGFIRCQHGVYPVPAPATANLLEGATVYSKHVEKELVTPTGAAILAATVDRFGPIGMRIERVGYGAGSMDFEDFPNCLRLVLGEEDPKPGPGVDRIVLIEANIDDMTPEQLAFAAEKLLEAGALDVTLVPVVMKKGRPGHILQVMAAPEDEARLSERVFRETTTIGVRFRPSSRRVLDRDWVTVELEGEPVRIKIAASDGGGIKTSPEFEDCARIASRTHRPLREIQEEAVRAYRTKQEQEKTDP